MMASDWERAKELFSTAIELPEAEREQFLAVQPDTPEILAEAQSLLANYLESPDFLEGVTAPLPDSDAEAAPSLGNRRIGAWRLLREIGRGGMGVVWEARRDDGQFEQLAAVKLLRASLFSDRDMSRFREERQILASLNHPAIARLLDGGMLEDGSPYLVMEYIDGAPIDQWCDHAQLDLRQRILLCLEVCAAVEYAHSQLVIHRDLKPANILVAGDGTPKLLDFGIAKLIAQTDERPEASTRLRTPECASPEQVRGERMSTANDVFALGVLFYKLFTGRHPFVEPETNPLAALRAVCEEEPRPPSGVAGPWRRELRGELDAILLQALRKNPAERYRSVLALAADLRAWLDGGPVTAVRLPWWRRSARLAWRHKAQSAAVAVAVGSLLAGIMVTSIEARQARQAEREALAQRNLALAENQRADNEARSAQAINRFLQYDLLAQASPNVQARPGTNPNPGLSVRAALDRAASRIGDRFQGQPLVEASIRQTIGESYDQLGLYGNARTQLEQALHLRRASVGEGNAATLESMNALATVFMHQASFADAESLYNTVLAKRRALLGAAHPDTLSTVSALASLEMNEGKYGRAEELSQGTVKLAVGAQLLTCRRLLSDIYTREGKFAQAEPILQALVAGERRLLGAEHPNTLESIDTLAMLYSSEDKSAQAEALEMETFNASQRVLGSDHPDTLTRMNNLAAIYHQEEKFGEAAQLFKRFLDASRRIHGPAHPETLTAIFNLAYISRVLGKFGEAERLLRQYLSLAPRINGPDHPETLSALNSLGTVYRCQGRYPQAERLIAKALEADRRTLGQEHPQTLVATTAMAILREDQGREVEAEPLLVKALATDRRVLSSADLSTRTCMTALARLRLKQDRHSEAGVLLREALANGAGPNLWDRFDRQSLLGASLLGQSQYAEAEPLLLAGYEGLRKLSPAISVDANLTEAGQRLIRLYAAWGKPEAAAEWRQKLQANTP